MTFRATVLTIFPDMFPGPLGLSLAGGLAPGRRFPPAGDRAVPRHQRGP